jgi:hypothetical protein
MPLSTIFQLYRGGFFYGGGNWNTRGKLPTYRKSLTNFITKHTYDMTCTSYIFLNGE